VQWLLRLGPLSAAQLLPLLLLLPQRLLPEQLVAGRQQHVAVQLQRLGVLPGWMCG